jgi:hypothetical protein
MSRRKKQNSKIQDPSRDEAEQRFKSHLRELGLASVAEYKDWCRSQGFSLKTDKSRRQRDRERLVVVRHAAETRLSQSQREKRNTNIAIAQIFDGKIKSDDVRQRNLANICQGYEATKKDRHARHALRDLLLHIKPDSDFFDHRPAISHLGWQPGNTYIEGLTSLAFQSRSWCRPVADWKPRSHNARRQFASLARHLLAEYDVPSFFDVVWFRGTAAAAAKQQRWFIHVGRGNNIRTAGLPIPYTKRMAHHFMQAPSDYTVEAAIRWGQIHGLGGDARLADAIRGTRLGEVFQHDEFWTSVLRFFIANPMLDTAHVGPIIDYLYDQRFALRDVFVAPGVIERQPPVQPSLCMKGRTPASLLAQVRRWHRQLNHEVSGNVQWARSGIGELEFLEGSKESGNLKRWTIRELLSAKALNVEGRAMRHCVASYAGSCARRATSIWAMEVESFAGRFKVLTVEVRLGSKTICQARGKCNALPDTKALNILRRWASREGLTVANYI